MAIWKNFTLSKSNLNCAIKVKHGFILEYLAGWLFLNIICLLKFKSVLKINESDTKFLHITKLVKKITKNGRLCVLAKLLYVP